MLKVKDHRGQSFDLVGFRLSQQDIIHLRELQAHAKVYVMAYTSLGTSCLIMVANLDLSSLIPLQALNPKWSA